MAIVVTVICPGQRDERERMTCSGGGWWGPDAPKRCPKCDQKLLLRDETLEISLRSE